MQMHKCTQALQLLRVSLDADEVAARHALVQLCILTLCAASISLTVDACCLQLALRKIATNVLEQPSEVRFRRLRCSNSTLATKVLPIPGAKLLLHALGFEETSADEPAEVVLLMPHASVDTDLLQQALSGLNDLMKPVSTALAAASSVPGPRPPDDLRQREAGTPVTLRTWDSRFRRPTCVVSMATLVCNLFQL